MRMKLTMDVQLPSPPNFLRYGPEGAHLVDVADMNEEDLKELGVAMTDALLLHARKRREDQRKSPPCVGARGAGATP